VRACVCVCVLCRTRSCVVCSDICAPPHRWHLSVRSHQRRAAASPDLSSLFRTNTDSFEWSTCLSNKCCSDSSHRLPFIVIAYWLCFRFGLPELSTRDSSCVHGQPDFTVYWIWSVYCACVVTWRDGSSGIWAELVTRESRLCGHLTELIEKPRQVPANNTVSYQVRLVDYLADLEGGQAGSPPPSWATDWRRHSRSC